MINSGWRSLTALGFVGDKQVLKFTMPEIILGGSNGQVDSVHYFLIFFFPSNGTHESAETPSPS